MPQVSRRRFLQISAAVASLAGASGWGVTRAIDARAEARKAGGPLRKVPTFCDLCFWKCGAIAYVEGDRLWKLEGNPDDPLSRGRLCPRGSCW